MSEPMNNIPGLTPIATIESNSKFKEKKIYSTTFKKGNLVQTLHFEHDGPITEAVEKIKRYLKNRQLKHIHTVPFLVDAEIIDDPNLNENENDSENSHSVVVS